ncbi:MAG TPA: hypothetical protein VFO70_07310, partial [Chitinophagaceae bacterium]|nr:hypothetical protein [Chitinophagaceae bacterium]
MKRVEEFLEPPLRENMSHKLHKLFFNDILYLEGYKDYTKLFLSGIASPFLIFHNLKYFEALFVESE